MIGKLTSISIHSFFFTKELSFFVRYKVLKVFIQVSSAMSSSSSIRYLGNCLSKLLSDKRVTSQ